MDEVPARYVPATDLDFERFPLLRKAFADAERSPLAHSSVEMDPDAGAVVEGMIAEFRQRLGSGADRDPLVVLHDSRFYGLSIDQVLDGGEGSKGRRLDEKP